MKIIAPILRLPCLIFCLVVLLQTPVHAAADNVAPVNATYAEWLRWQLANEYGLSGGESLFFEGEYLLQTSITVDANHHRNIRVADMPFTRATQVEIKEMPQYLWSEGMWLKTRHAVQKGDTVLLTFWTRSIEAQVGNGMVSVAFEEQGTWEKSLHWSAEPDNQWKQHFLPFTIKEDYKARDAHLSFQFGAQLQTLEIAGIAAINYGKSVPVTQLPIDDISTYPGREPDAAWRKAAAQRIALYRMGDLDVRVIDQMGRPIEDVQVDVKMQNHAFEWGSAVKTHQINGSDATAQQYRARLLDLDGKGHGFNVAVPENALKWTNWELNSGWWLQAQTSSAVGWLAANGLQIHGHNAVWGNWAHLPADMRANQNDPVYNANRIDERITEVLTDPRLLPITSWDILNEGRDTDVLPAIFSRDPRYQTGQEPYGDWYKLANATAPETKHYINDFSIVSVGGLMVSSQEGYRDIIGRLLAEDVGLDGIGMQAHMFYPLTPPERVYTILNDFAEPFGLPLRITEFDVTVWDEQLAADYLRDFLTVLYSHPAAESFIMWDFYDGSHWLDNAPLYRDDWTLKPAGAAFIDLVFDQWWTDETGYADQTGHYRTQAFAGDYLITATTAKGETRTRFVSLDNTAATVNLIINLDLE